MHTEKTDGDLTDRNPQIECADCQMEIWDGIDRPILRTQFMPDVRLFSLSSLLPLLHHADCLPYWHLLNRFSLREGTALFSEKGDDRGE